MARSFKQLSEPVKADPRRRARIVQQKQAILDALQLAALRESRNITQQQVAEELHVSQANISRIEHQEDVYLSTLRNYVAALGGQLEVKAVFPDETVDILSRHSS